MNSRMNRIEFIREVRQTGNYTEKLTDNEQALPKSLWQLPDTGYE